VHPSTLYADRCLTYMSSLFQTADLIDILEGFCDESNPEGDSSIAM
jgi:hypothetical protein